MRQKLDPRSLIGFRSCARGSPVSPSNLGWTALSAVSHAVNLYYVGSKGLASYLITTPEGNILINSDLETNVPMISASTENNPTHLTRGGALRLLPFRTPCGQGAFDYAPSTRLSRHRNSDLFLGALCSYVYLFYNYPFS